jgi:uncharacterized membrane protein
MNNKKHIIFVAAIFFILANSASIHARAFELQAYAIRLAGNVSQYSKGDPVEVEVTTGMAGILESSLASNSTPVVAGVTKINIGKVADIGLFPVRFVATSGTPIGSDILILPGSTAGKFTVEIILDRVKIAAVPTADSPAFIKFIKLVDTNLMAAAWKKEWPNWIVQNMANLGQAAVQCAVFSTGTLGVGVFWACAMPAASILADALAAVLARVADDLKAAQILSAADVVSIKRVLTGLKTVAQTVTTKNIIDRIISVSEGVNSVVLDQTDKAQVTNKVIHDAAKKFTMILEFKGK